MISSPTDIGNTDMLDLVYILRVLCVQWSWHVQTTALHMTLLHSLTFISLLVTSLGSHNLVAG